MGVLQAVAAPRTLTVAFAAALTVWWVWFLTHLPWLGLSEQVSIPTILASWALALFIGAGALRRSGLNQSQTLTTSAVAGFLSSLLGLLILGSKLTTSAGLSAPVELRPAAALMILGFLSIGLVLGLLAGFGGAKGPAFPHHNVSDQRWLGRFAVLTVFAVVPLLVVGGLVTSSNSGMAVPDWPNTYGTNMFLYPLGPRAAPSIFLEHSHRLFGTFVGLTAIALFFLTLRHSDRRFLWFLAGLALFLVIAQGLLGGFRVLQGSTDAATDARWSRVVHGVLAQFIFCIYVILAVRLGVRYQHVRQQAEAGTLEFGHGSKQKLLRVFSAAAMHATLLQLVFGAMYRHTRAPHALWAHIGFSVIVVLMALLAGFAARTIRFSDTVEQFVRRVALLTLICVTFQSLLGGVVLMLGGTKPDPDSVAQVLLRSAHHANGAALLALVRVLMMWGRALSPRKLAPVAPVTA